MRRPNASKSTMGNIFTMAAKVIQQADRNILPRSIANAATDRRPTTTASRCPLEAISQTQRGCHA